MKTDRRPSGFQIATLAAAAVAMTLLPAQASGAQYEVGKASEVSFVAKITASSFIAKSEALSGTVEFDEAAGTISGGRIQVKADSFKTGMGLRDRHMRDKYLQAKKFPAIMLDLGASTIAGTAGSKGTIEGNFTIRGVKKPMKAAVVVSESLGGKIVVTAKFKLDITDYGIKQPGFAVVKMETVIDVTVELVLQRKG